ncbi:hypothetical protein BH23PAT2_BH23PAT2_07120 [soil metagenome]
MSVILLPKNVDLELVSLLRLLDVYANVEGQSKPYLIKDGLKIIL